VCGHTQTQKAPEGAFCVVKTICGTIPAMNEVLSALFGSSARVKILRLFLSNPDMVYSPAEVAERAKVHIQTTKKEIALLYKIGLLKQHSMVQQVTTGRGAKKKVAKRKVAGYGIDREFKDLTAMRNFILNIAPTDEKGIAKKVSSVGKIRLIIVAGEFLRDPDSRVDILIVGDAMKDSRIKAVVRDLEAHMGKELRYAAFSTEDFTYRLSIYDRLIRDVLDYPHQIVVDKLPVGWQDVHMRKTRFS